MQLLWQALLHLTQSANAHPGDADYCTLRFGKEPAVAFDAVLPPQSGHRRVQILLNDQARAISDPAVAVVKRQNSFSARVIRGENLKDEEIRLMEHYLPYSLLAFEARKHRRAVAVSHFAQSLDGKIATITGDSKWIGNEANLVHAHRMRALCDGILIGTRTLQYDQPSLTVRKVVGENPRRIVISSSARDFSSLVNSCSDPVMVLGGPERESQPQLEYISLPMEDGQIACDDILSCLYEKGIHSVYIEGGAETTSNFLREKAIDILQLHLSPRIFGSGVSGVSLPEILEVQDAFSFRQFHFQPVGDTFMFVGELNRD
ncbi:MAG: RibD family protein [Bacteroidota bacterium]